MKKKKYKSNKRKNRSHSDEKFNIILKIFQKAVEFYVQNIQLNTYKIRNTYI